MIIAVDGPSAAGKGTIARGLARHFGFHFLDTGKLYRMVGLEMLRTQTNMEDETRAAAVASELDPLAYEDEDLRRETVAAAASRVSALPGVRAALLALQRNFARKPPGAVLDGRDIGTIVCPDAHVKLFITASLEVRSHRRFLELKALDDKVALQQVRAEVTARDHRDSTRAIAPLVPASDATVLDTTNLSSAEAIAAAIAIVEQALQRPELAQE
jgi:CMP/dCMP kinase